MRKAEAPLASDRESDCNGTSSASLPHLTSNSYLADHVRPMSSAVILQQAAHQGPGRIVPVFRDFGIPTEVRHLYKGDQVPTDLDEIRVLVVLDGPMKVSDIAGDAHPFLAKEVE